jgi:hypothetical protein
VPYESLKDEHIAAIMGNIPNLWKSSYEHFAVAILEPTYND